MSSLDIASAQSSFWGHLQGPSAQLFFSRTHQIKLYRRGQRATVVKAIATLERRNSTVNDHGSRFEPRLRLGSDPSQSTADDDPEMDDREKTRRERISKANKGNVPWNKGRKHSPETLAKIRERTKQAMQNPKVKMKLVNIGHAQSEETRMKIGAGVREGWQRRREMLMVQESCFFEWQNVIAEASRKGYGGEEELQWDSYETLDEQLKKEWAESVESRKKMPRPKGSKRAPKSPEQRRKISEAISAKWSDPDYRVRVCSGLAKYHGIPVGVERRPRRSPASDGEPRVPRKRSSQSKEPEKEAKPLKPLVPKPKKINTPSYKDPMAKSKLEMIRKIREQRASMEEKKRDATERARLLIAEAEKAAKALEIVALKSPLARASLLETRRLIAEATQALERAGQPPLPTPPENPNGSQSYHSVQQRVNGTPSKTLISDLPSEEADDLDLDLELGDLLTGGEPIPPSDLPASSSEETFADFSSRSGDAPSPPAETRRRWVRGRLVDVDDE
ncbi:muscle M-line assembly protein [Wolffia australiana]